ncbi:hypothetical protein F383_09282 [Gossypium arboreum]|uniref:Uncharacterized protein n=1 Tax=Gossypium arboreum TaxID=29729 RepID=A0A0B0P843_GOSAR|nr:hypothetical protein F383_09282 [Gossypium arboreum]
MRRVKVPFLAIPFALWRARLGWASAKSARSAISRLRRIGAARGSEEATHAFYVTILIITFKCFMWVVVKPLQFSGFQIYTITNRHNQTVFSKLYESLRCGNGGMHV